MANHRDPIPDWLNAKYMQNVMRSSFKKTDLIVDRIEVEPGSAVGDNYACQIFRIRIHFENTGEILPIIGKLKPKTKILGELSEFDVFEVEALFFTDILQRLSHVEKQSAPMPYHVDYEHQIVFMEDLRKNNFDMHPRNAFLDLEQAKLVVESLAVFHGSSYYALQKDPSLKKRCEISFLSNPPNSVITKLINNGCASLEKWLPTYGLTDGQVKKLKGLRNFIWDNWYKITEKKDGRLTVLCHGDCWKNNMMFQNEKDQVCLLDFQCINYNSFGNDLQHFIFSSVQSDLIISHLDLILEFYYKRLKEVAPDIPDLSFERIKREFNEQYVLGVIFSLTFRPIMICDVPIDMEDVMDGNEQDTGYNDELYISDLKVILPYFEKAGYFD